MQKSSNLVVIATHPIQYHAPVYRFLQQRYSIPVTAIYGSDFSVTGYHDQEFNATFAWDTDLLGGYQSVFLSRTADRTAPSAYEVFVGGLDRILHQLAPSAILLTGYSPKFYQVAIWHAYRSGCPLLFRAETTDHTRVRGLFQRVIRDQALAWLYRQCKALLYIGQHSREHYRRLGCQEERLFFSPYCVDADVFQTSEEARTRLRDPLRNEIGACSEDIVLLFSGKLVPRKQPDLLLQAVKVLPERIRVRIHVIFLGDGLMRDQLKMAAQTAPVVHVHMPGFQNQKLLSKYYHAADLLILPSYIGETWGLVVNEALHHGLPCVVSNMVGCAPDLIESGVTGEIFTAGSVSSLATTLTQAINLIGCASTRAQCREKVRNYTVEQAAMGIVAAYESI